MLLFTAEAPNPALTLSSTYSGAEGGQVLVPAFTFAACVVLGLEHLQADLTLAVLLIAGGTGITTLVESGTAGFSWVGFWVMTLSVFLEALRVVFMQVPPPGNTAVPWSLWGLRVP